MLTQCGDPDSAIVLLGDSRPQNCQCDDLTPLDPRHPTRHSIWTPIQDVMQRHLFRVGSRLDDRDFYIRNAVGDGAEKSDKQKVSNEIAGLRDFLNKHRPALVLCFGQFSFECARRAQGEEESHAFRYWTVTKLADQFSTRISQFLPDKVNIVPLLHAVVAQQFVYCHKEFSGGTGNYFEYAGQEIANALIKNRRHPRLRELWM